MKTYDVIDVPANDPCENCTPCLRLRLMDMGFITGQKIEIEVYDYSVSEDETINLKDGIKDNLVTRLGLQVRFTNAENGTIIAASGLGEAKTNRQLTLLSDATVDPIKFNQSTISISTKKALDIACANILDKMIKKGVFTK